MPPQESYNQDMSPEDAKASMGHANLLIEQLLAAQAPQQAPQQPQNAPQQEQTQEPEEDTSDELQGIKDEISALKDEIHAVLEEDNQEDNGSEKTET